ncbi:DUF4446 family protein [Paenibacillus sp. DYY-L-2]|uniref:DUF4446 family protein n=1 Tax=Paenibacillus sp. DYY-L-2 TaxID=3447013 RepID=UPI003F4FC53A
MREWNQLILDQLAWIVGGVAVAILLLLVWNIVQGAKLRKLRRKYMLMMNGTGIEDLEDLLIDLKNGQGKLEDAQAKQQQDIARISALLPKQKSKIGIKRYNAFGERGNELSFSLAIVDDLKDGVVITGLYSRDGSYVYAKALTKGESTHALSNEEVEAIALAGSEE